jgi:hypothetical protein
MGAEPGRRAWRAGVAIVALMALSALAAALLAPSPASGPPRLSPYASGDLGAADEAAPILVLLANDAANPFGRYLVEILRAEGVNGFRVADWPVLSTLDGFDTIVLAEGPVDDVRADRLAAYVAEGGLLIGMRSDPRLAALFGVERQGGTSAEGYLRMDADHILARGIDHGALRFHGEADHYRPAGAETVAWLGDESGAPSVHPAVTIHRHGRGTAVLWVYDLARSVAYARQGNPAWAGEERDGLAGVRACDMFPGWIDLERMAIPQADEQQRLLANVVSMSRGAARPVPRLWYFPRAADAVLVATGDAHESPAYAVADVLGRAERRGGRMSIYYTPPRSGPLRRAARRLRWWAAGLPLIGGRLTNPTGFPAPSEIATWRARGHEFALHPFVEGGHDLADEWEGFSALGYGPVPPTMRTHRVLWTGWVETARRQASAGIRMNLDFYQVGPAFRAASGEWSIGYFTGSGLPMRFVGEDGRVLDIFQQATQLVDEHWLDVSWGGQAKLAPKAALDAAGRLLRAAVERAPAAIAAQFHVDSFVHAGPHQEAAARWMEGTLDMAAERGVPIVSAAEWLRFTEIRHGTRFHDVDWNASAGRLTFRVSAAAAAGVESTLMLPLRHDGARLDTCEVDGAAVAFGRRTVGAVDYGTAGVATGSHGVVAGYVRDGESASALAPRGRTVY